MILCTFRVAQWTQKIPPPICSIRKRVGNIVVWAKICLKCYVFPRKDERSTRDHFVENHVVVELKTVDSLQPIHDAQLLTYMRLTESKTGLLINFKVPVLKDGVKRMVL